MARNRIATKAIENGVLVVSFTDGNKQICDASVLSDEIKEKLMLHGLAQKVGDAYASAESVDEARASAGQVWEGLLAGNWTTRSEGGQFAEAIARATGKAIGEVIEMLRTIDEKTKKALTKHPAILKAHAEIMAERAKVSNAVDLNELF